MYKKKIISTVAHDYKQKDKGLCWKEQRTSSKLQVYEVDIDGFMVFGILTHFLKISYP